MPKANKLVTSALLNSHQAEILQQWMRRLKEDGALESGRIRESELQAQCSDFLSKLRDALAKGSNDIDGAEFAPVRAVLSDLSASRATQGFSPRETAMFVFSLKQPLFDAAAAARRAAMPRARWKPTGRSACCSIGSACSPSRRTRRPARS